jgi:hypothetical protein
MGVLCQVVGVAALASLAGFAYNTYTFLQFGVALSYSDGGCRLVAPEGMAGSEDMALGRNSLLFVTQGDLHHAFAHGALAAKPGHIWALDLAFAHWDPASAKPVKVALRGFPAGRRFQPHGLYVSNATDLLYAVSHTAPQGGSAVEVFEIDYAARPVALVHVKTVSSELFAPFSINDVAEGGGRGELYVTRWLPFGFPSGGKDHPTTTYERLAAASMVPIALGGLKLTQFYRCTWSADGETACAPAAPERFGGANGITISTDRKTVFVSDPAFASVTTYDRAADGSLAKTGTIAVEYAMDNIEYDAASGELLMGSIALLHTVVANDGKPLAEWRPVPGGMSVAARSAETGAWVVRHPLMHDGSVLSQISAAARLGGVVVLGSPFSDGVLVCEVP